MRAGSVTLCLLLAGLLAVPASAVRLKDLAFVKGVRSNQLTGYGLVVGLNTTGDKDQTEFTRASLASVLARMGVGVDPAAIKVKDVAAVMVTSSLPPFAGAGSRIDVLVSATGDASSLEGGTLLMTPLYGADGKIYAIAQGPISVGGFSAGGSAGSSVQKNHPTVGRLVGGGSVERELPFSIEGQHAFDLVLRDEDFTTAKRMADKINEHFGPKVAWAPDPGTIRIQVPDKQRDGVVSFLAEVESLEVEPDQVARVVLNERTGTVVMGNNVRISTVAVAHGSLSVTITANNQVSQPAPFSRGGRTTEVTNQDVSAVEEEAHLTVVKGAVTIDELVRGLNAMGVTPRDLISILQAIKASGALSAELELL